MFEVIGHWVLVALRLRRHEPDEDIFGSYYARNEGPLEFIVGLLACILVMVAVMFGVAR